MSDCEPFPVEVVAEVVKYNLQLAYYEDVDEPLVSCDNLSCGECPINDYTTNPNDCKEAVTYIRNKQLPSLLVSNPELFL